jgi:hypothetical protein
MKQKRAARKSRRLSLQIIENAELYFFVVFFFVP